MVKIRMVTLPAFAMSGVKTWISGQHNEEFADFWRQCNEDGTSEKLKKASSGPATNRTHSRIMGISRVERDPGNRAFDFYIAAEAESVDECESFVDTGNP